MLAERADVDHFTLALCPMGVNLVGPLLLSKGGVKFLVVAVDYFTKWVEAKVLTTISASNTPASCERTSFAD